MECLYLHCIVFAVFQTVNSLSNSEKYQTKIERKEGGLHNIEDLSPQKYGNIPLDNPKDIKKIKISKK